MLRHADMPVLLVGYHELIMENKRGSSITFCSSGTNAPRDGEEAADRGETHCLLVVKTAAE